MVCIAPELAFRIAFSFFAILASLFCLLISVSILLMHGERLEKCIKYMLQAMYVVFGPIMLVGCVISSVKINRLFYVCIDNDPKAAAANYCNLLVILVCSALSLSITLAYMISYIVSALNIFSAEQNSWFAAIGRCYWRWRFEGRLRRYIERRREEMMAAEDREDERSPLKEEKEESQERQSEHVEVHVETEDVKRCSSESMEASVARLGD